MLKRVLVVLVSLGVVLLLASPVVLYAVRPRPLMDPSPPWFVMGPHCGDADNKASAECAGAADWRVRLLGTTYSKETWPTWPWELL